MSAAPAPDLLEVIRARAGSETVVNATVRGFGTDFTGVATGAAGRFFVKAMRNRPGGRREQMLRERDINPYVRTLAPSLEWSVENDHWIVLGFTAVDAGPADFAPGTGDLPAVVDLVNAVGALPLPGIAEGWRETRWDWWADEGAAVLFRGDTLLHADVNPGNVLIGSDRCWMVDWSWPTRGAAFIDPAMLVLQLVSAGHTPAAAERCAAGCVAWTEADPSAIDAFAVAYARMLRHLAARRPDELWRQAMAAAALAWTEHRRLTVG